MLLEHLEKRINLSFLREEFRKIGGNFITAGMVGIFINHYVGLKLSTMFWSAFWVSLSGAAFLTIGLIKIRGK
jgi:hypothetical protein